MQNLNPKLLLCLALVLCGGSSVSARAVRLWSDDELMKASNLVVVGQPVSTQDLNETNSLGWSSTATFQPRFRGVETTFKVFDVLKGMPANDRIVLHHYRYESAWGSPPNGPGLWSFASGDTNKLVLYLIADGPNRYAPAVGQLDSGLSIRPVPANIFFKFHMPLQPPIADADPVIRHPVQIRIPILLQAAWTNDSIKIETVESAVTNLTVGTNMATGTECETKVYQGGELLNLGGSSLQGGLADCGYSETLPLHFEKSLRPEEGFTVEIKTTMFETDEPAQHMWSPQSGKKYRVLWKQAFKLVVK